MTLTLDTIPGFADLPDTSLLANTPALGLYLNRISNNAAFGMVRMEVFVANYHDGDTVALPVSDVDGYQYSRAELTYVWAVQSTMNPSTNWISGADTLWYAAWLVGQYGVTGQTAGLVSCEEWYRRSGSNANPTQSSDGTLQVFTIAQRQQTALIMAVAATSYTDLADADFVTDAAFTQAMAQGLNDNAKFAVARGELIYMGEFESGNTVPRAVSPIDGYQYTYAEMTLQASWRWTVLGSSFAAPEYSTGQLAPILWSITASTGAVSITVNYVADGSTNDAPVSNFGRIAVFAFCSRTDLMGAVPGTANAFAEIDDSVFQPGQTLRASTVLQLNKNIRESACTPEFFGPTQYQDGDTVPLPTSPIDGYAYSRAEISYIWEWSDTTPASGGHVRTAAFTGSIFGTNGLVSLDVWRLADGGPIVPGLESGQHLRITVTVVAIRGSSVSTPVSASAAAPGDISSVVTDQSTINPYAIPYDAGDGAQPTANQSLLKHVIPGAGILQSVTFPSGLSASAWGSRAATTAAYVITIKHNGSSVGTINFAIGATTATFTFTSAVVASPGDVFEFVGQATPDATLAGLYGTLAGTRT